METIEITKKILHAILWAILLIIFYFIYMRTALEQYNARKTTMTQTQITVSQLETPIFIFCTDPPFKPSVLRKYESDNFVWADQVIRFENESASSSEVLDTYINMSYLLGSDLEIKTVLYDKNNIE